MTQNQGVPIFLFHHIRPDFEDYLLILRNKNIKTFTFSEAYQYLLMKKKIPSGTALITLDDGYIDNYSLGFPLLKKYGIKATIFLNTAFIGHDPRYMIWSQIEEMYQSRLVDFELHSHNHISVFTDHKIIRRATDDDIYNRELQQLYHGTLQPGDPIFNTRSAYCDRGMILTDQFFETRDPAFLIRETEKQAMERIQADVGENQKILNEKLSKRAIFFAWPWGDHSILGKKAIRPLGIKGFVTSRKGTNCRSFPLGKIYRVEHRYLTKFKFKLTLFVCQNLILGKIYKLLS